MDELTEFVRPFASLLDGDADDEEAQRVRRARGCKHSAVDRMSVRMKSPTEQQHWLALAQGAYYFVAGLWPIVNIQSLQLATGRKPISGL